MCKSTSRAMLVMGMFFAVIAGDKPVKALPLPKETSIPVGEKVSIRLVLVPSGSFTMGSPEGEKERSKDEGPQCEVTITKPFYMGTTEITQSQYEAVMGGNPSNFNGPENPVERVSWEDAVEFCKKLSEKSGKKVRLPTEAEWEYACRAGTKTRFSFGDADTDLGDYAWYPANSETKSHPVGQKKPNAWGLYDMHGNVFEWCSDWHTDYTATGKTDPKGPANGSLRMLRGGSWDADPGYCRSADRSWSPPFIRYDFVGFRVAVAAGVDLP